MILKKEKKQILVLMFKNFKLTKYTDPRCIEYWIKAFENTSLEILENYRINWISKYVKTKK